MNKKTSTVKKRHMEGRISHSKIRKTAGVLHNFATLIKVDPIDLGLTLLTKHEEFFRTVILPEEKRFKLLHKLVADTVKKIKKGEIAHPLRNAA